MNKECRVAGVKVLFALFPSGDCALCLPGILLPGELDTRKKAGFAASQGGEAANHQYTEETSLVRER